MQCKIYNLVFENWLGKKEKEKKKVGSRVKIDMKIFPRLLRYLTSYFILFYFYKFTQTDMSDFWSYIYPLCYYTIYIN